jgi:hypothetical protein
MSINKLKLECLKISQLHAASKAGNSPYCIGKSPSLSFRISKEHRKLIDVLDCEKCSHSTKMCILWSEGENLLRTVPKKVKF